MDEQNRYDDAGARLGDARGPATLERLTAAWQQTTDALHDTERRYRELVEYSLGLICTHDLTGTILSINPAAARSLGYQPHEGIGHNLREFLSADTRHLFDDYLRRITANGHDAGLMRVVDRDGRDKVWMYRNVLSHGRAGAYVLGHAIDVTDRVEAERTLRVREQALRAAQSELEARVRERTTALEEANERLRLEIAQREKAQQDAQEANRLKDEFLSTLSHELRTPLNAIYGWARILKNRNLDKSTAHAIGVIERNAETQVRLIEEVLDVSRIIKGKMTLAMDPVDVATIVRETVDTVRPAMHAKRIRFEERIRDTRPVLGDRHRLHQVFWNLLSNAVKFTGSEGTIAITVRTADDSVEFEIADTGIGIGRDVLPFVFDRFRQGDSSTTRTHGGLGLGLAIVRHIVELHGGTVRASSPGVGHGATFTIQLPSAEREHRAPAEPGDAVRHPAAVVRPLHGRSVLVVEDHDDARELIAGVLEAAGAEVMCAPTTQQAIDQVARQRPDVLVADLGLPDEDGYALLVRFRAIYPNVPAIALTAYARATDRERALAAGFQRHVIKPADPDELVETIRAVVDPDGSQTHAES